jgi:hypothetical protein
MGGHSLTDRLSDLFCRVHVHLLVCEHTNSVSSSSWVLTHLYNPWMSSPLAELAHSPASTEDVRAIRIARLQTDIVLHGVRPPVLAVLRRACVPASSLGSDRSLSLGVLAPALSSSSTPLMQRSAASRSSHVTESLFATAHTPHTPHASCSSSSDPRVLPSAPQTAQLTVQSATESAVSVLSPSSSRSSRSPSSQSSCTPSRPSTRPAQQTPSPATRSKRVCTEQAKSSDLGKSVVEVR